MRHSTFAFEPFRKSQVKNKKIEEKKQYFTVSVKHGYIVFPKGYVRDNGLDGKLVKWYFDKSKRALAWTVMDSENSLSELREYSMVKALPSNGTYQMQIRRLLNLFEFKDENISFKKLEVQKYISTDLGSYGKSTFCYLILENPTSLAPKE